MSTSFNQPNWLGYYVAITLFLKYTESANEYVSTFADNYNFRLCDELVQNGRNLPPWLIYQFRDRIVYKSGELLLFDKDCPLQQIPSYGEDSFISSRPKMET